MLSSISSLIIIIFSEFMNQNPMIDYYKNNDFITNKTIKISDSFIMFQIITNNCNNMKESHISFESYYSSNGMDEDIPLKVEPCEYGKNIELKHQELFKDFEKREKESIDNYFCINFNKKNISFFHHPNDNNANETFLKLIVYLNESVCDVNSFLIKIVSENDIIEHNTKENLIFHIIIIIHFLFLTILKLYHLNMISNILNMKLILVFFLKI